MNLNKMTPALIANYTDMEMRQGIQGVEQSEIDRR